MCIGVGGKGYTGKYTPVLFSDDGRYISPTASQTQHNKINSHGASREPVLTGSPGFLALLPGLGYAAGEPIAPRALTWSAGHSPSGGCLRKEELASLLRPHPP